MSKQEINVKGQAGDYIVTLRVNDELVLAGRVPSVQDAATQVTEYLGEQS